MAPTPTVTADSARSPQVGFFVPVAACPPEPGRGDLAPLDVGWSDLVALAVRAEELGFDSFWLSDHLLMAFGEEAKIGFRECWTLLAGLAGVTTRLRLGPLVTSTTYRNPALIAKMAETVDEMSGGRVVLGIGAGHIPSEAHAFGFPYDHRASRFEEAIQIITGLLRDRTVDFAGTWYRARGCELLPTGPRRQGPPVLVGAEGPRMIRIAARYADELNIDVGTTLDPSDRSAPRSMSPAATLAAIPPRSAARRWSRSTCRRHPSPARPGAMSCSASARTAAHRRTWPAFSAPTRRQDSARSRSGSTRARSPGLRPSSRCSTCWERARRTSRLPPGQAWRVLIIGAAPARWQDPRPAPGRNGSTPTPDVRCTDGRPVGGRPPATGQRPGYPPAGSHGRSGEALGSVGLARNRQSADRRRSSMCDRGAPPPRSSRGGSRRGRPDRRARRPSTQPVGTPGPTTPRGCLHKTGPLTLTWGRSDDLEAFAAD